MGGIDKERNICRKGAPRERETEREECEASLTSQMIPLNYIISFSFSFVDLSSDDEKCFSLRLGGEPASILK